MHYSRSHTKILVGTTKGQLGVLPITAEKIEDEEDDEQQEFEKQTFNNPFQVIGKYHTDGVNGVVALGNST